MQEPRISILSRNEIVREGLRRILVDRGFAVEQTVTEATNLRIDGASEQLVIVDATNFDDGLGACDEVRQQSAMCRIVLMVDEYVADDVAKAFSTGAVDGYLVKAISCEPLAGALRLIAMGEKLLPSQFAESFSSPMAHVAPRTWNANGGGLNLSGREIEILRCLVDGDANKLISRRLHIADATVKVHIKAILRKLRVKNRTQAAIWAVNRGLSSDPAPVMSVAVPPMRIAEPLQVAATH